MRIVEIGNARFIENGEINGSIVPRNVESKKVRVKVPLTCASDSKVSVPLDVVPNNNKEEKHDNEPMIQNEPIVEEWQEVAIRRSQRQIRPIISNDYVVYLHELQIELSIIDDDLVSFS